MKFTAAILVAFILAVGFGSTPVAANRGNALSTNLFNKLLGAVNTLLDSFLIKLFDYINNIFFVLLKSLLNLITLLVPGRTQLNLAKLLPPLLALEKPTLSSVAATLFRILRVDGTAILTLIPGSVGRTPINLNILLKTAAPFTKGKTITLEKLLLALALYLSKYEYSIKFPLSKI